MTATIKPDLTGLAETQAQGGLLKETLGDSVEVGTVLKNQLRPAKRSLVKNVSKILLPVVASVGIIAAAPALAPLATALIIGAGAGASLFTALGSTNEIKQDIESIKQGDPATQYPAMLVGHTSPEAEGAKLDIEPGDSTNKAAKEMLSFNAKSFPTSHHIVHFVGHGFGDRYAAGQSGEEMANSVKHGAQQAGKNMSVVLAETCYSGNLELASRMADSADTFVAFEDMGPATHYPTGRIPLHEMLAQAVDKSGSNEVAKALTKQAGEHLNQDIPGHPGTATSPVGPAQRMQFASSGLMLGGIDSTVVAYDLKMLKGKLHPALGELGERFTKLTADDPSFKTELQQSRDASFIDSKSDLVDMGTFLDSISRSEKLDEKTKKSIQSTQKALRETVIEKRTSESFPLSGMSFHTKLGEGESLFGEFQGKFSKPGSGSNLPTAWTNFVSQELGQTGS